jgi:hypothetical protein
VGVSFERDVAVPDAGDAQAEALDVRQPTSRNLKPEAWRLKP